ncbi:MAG: hypothetical protein CMJ76_04410 [Planctomycetaceae bacterium]|nr:hypothetical protein [Planctomycetaceae bacterium]
MSYLRLIPALLLALFLTGCGSDEIEVSEEQSAAQKKVEELGGAWTGRGAISIDFSATQMAQQGKKISDDDLAILAEVENLEMLDLSGSPISDAGIKHITGLTKVNTINLTGTQITGEGINAIMDLPLFQIAYKNCNDDVAVAIGNITTIKILQLDGPQLTNVGIAALGELPELRQLTLSGTNLTNEGLATLSNLRNLNALDISNTAISDEGLGVLGGLSGLNSVSLSGTRVTQNGVAKLQQLLPETFIDFENLETQGQQDRFAGEDNGSQPPQNRDADESEKSPLEAITSFFTGGDKETPDGQEVAEEPAEEEEKGGGTLGAIFRSLNPVD